MISRRARSAAAFSLVALASFGLAAPAPAQPGEPKSHSYLAFDPAPIVALVGVDVLDGTGGAARSNQVVVIEGDRIASVGPRGEVSIPEGAKVLDLPGRTVIPGIVGTHNHTHMPGIHFMGFTAPRLYLASGVTTIQTTGSASPAEEVALAQAIERGEAPGPRIVASGPYFTGEGGSPAMIHPEDAAHIERVVRRWTAEGVRWFKAYRHIAPDDLRELIRVAHAHGAKVSGHLCSVTYAEAAEMGIDVIEHGFLHSFDHADGKMPGTCSGSRDFRDLVDPIGPAARRVQRAMIEHGVALSSTLAIFEAQVPERATADERTLAAMSPAWVADYEARRRRMTEQGDDWRFRAAWLEQSMRYDRAFFEAGGLLTAGLDPGLHNLPGFGDQRNFELLVEAGFSTGEAIQVMTSNGARLLDLPDVGTIAPGKQADLVVLRGDLEDDPRAIRSVEMVFRHGLAYDPEKLLDEVRGQVGLR